MEKNAALEKLTEYADSGCHLLIPTTQHLESLSEQFTIIIETVKLSGHPKDRDVYPHENGCYDYKNNAWKTPAQAGKQKVRLTKQGLNKLNILSGIMWSPTLCREIRDLHISGRMAYVAVGGVRKPDGTPYFIEKTYAMDIDVERQKLESQYSSNQNKEYLVSRDLLQKKSNIATLCESGAKNRVTREILCLDNFYTVEAMEKEFVMARVIPKLDLSDEYTKHRLIDLQLQALTGIYGPSAPSPDRRAIEYAAPIDIKTVEESGKDDDPPPPQQGQITPEQKAESRLKDFENSDAVNQSRTLTNMVINKDYDSGAYLKRAGKEKFSDLSEKARIGLFNHLMTLPDKAPSGEIPY